MEIPLNDRTDRRRVPRRQSLEEHGIVDARVRPGHAVALVDVSAGGALIESTRRLLPGTSIELHLASVGRRVSVRGRVLRCAVAGLKATGVWYRGAIGFEHALSWFREDPGDDEAGYSVPAAETPAFSSRRGDVTRTAR